MSKIRVIRKNGSHYDFEIPTEHSRPNAFELIDALREIEEREGRALELMNISPIKDRKALFCVKVIR